MPEMATLRLTYPNTVCGNSRRQAGFFHISAFLLLLGVIAASGVFSKFELIHRNFTSARAFWSDGWHKWNIKGDSSPLSATSVSQKHPESSLAVMVPAIGVIDASLNGEKHQFISSVDAGFPKSNVSLFGFLREYREPHHCAFGGGFLSLSANGVLISGQNVSVCISRVGPYMASNTDVRCGRRSIIIQGEMDRYVNALLSVPFVEFDRSQNLSFGGYPRSLLGDHLIQLPLHRSLLVSHSAPLEACESGGNSDYHDSKPLTNNVSAGTKAVLVLASIFLFVLSFKMYEKSEQSPIYICAVLMPLSGVTGTFGFFVLLRAFDFAFP
jgi:hypothetical protein